MGEDEEVQKLAESLKGSGLAASMMDAINKAEDILGYSNKGVKIRVGEPKPDQKSKVDKIIKEVEEEIEQKKKIVEPVQERLNSVENNEESKKSSLNFSDHSFNVAESNMTVNEVAGGGEVMLNDNDVLKQEKEPNHAEETEQNIVMTNDEIEQEDDEGDVQFREDNEINVQEQSDEIDEKKRRRKVRSHLEKRKNLN